MAEFRISILFQYFMYILAEFNTFSRSWKPISQFNTFPILSIPREDPDNIFPTGFLWNHTLEQVIPLESCQSLRTLYSRLSKGPGNARYWSVRSAPGLRSRSRKESEVFGWSRRFLGRVGGFWVESEVFGKSRRFLGGVGGFWEESEVFGWSRSRTFYLRLRNPGRHDAKRAGTHWTARQKCARREGQAGNSRLPAGFLRWPALCPGRFHWRRIWKLRCWESMSED